MQKYSFEKFIFNVIHKFINYHSCLSMVYIKYNCMRLLEKLTLICFSVNIIFVFEILLGMKWLVYVEVIRIFYSLTTKNHIILKQVLCFTLSSVMLSRELALRSFQNFKTVVCLTLYLFVSKNFYLLVFSYNFDYIFHNMMLFEGLTRFSSRSQYQWYLRSGLQYVKYSKSVININRCKFIFQNLLIIRLVRC